MISQRPTYLHSWFQPTLSLFRIWWLKLRRSWRNETSRINLSWKADCHKTENKKDFRSSHTLFPFSLWILRNSITIDLACVSRFLGWHWTFVVVVVGVCCCIQDCVGRGRRCIKNARDLTRRIRLGRRWCLLLLFTRCPVCLSRIATGRCGCRGVRTTSLEAFTWIMRPFAVVVVVVNKRWCSICKWIWIRCTTTATGGRSIRKDFAGYIGRIDFCFLIETRCQKMRDCNLCFWLCTTFTLREWFVRCYRLVACDDTVRCSYFWKNPQVFNTIQ